MGSETNSDTNLDSFQGEEEEDLSQPLDFSIGSDTSGQGRSNEILGTTVLCGTPIISLLIDNVERLCLAQISNTLLKEYSYNEIHNRRVALGIRCVQCTPVQLELLRRAGAMAMSSRRCGMITRHEAERLVKSFCNEITVPKLPDDFFFDVVHHCGWGTRGSFYPARYNSSRAKCIRCYYCHNYYSPNKFIFHCHQRDTVQYRQPDAANFNAWRRHLSLKDGQDSELMHVWEDVKAMFNGGSRKRVINSTLDSFKHSAANRMAREEKHESENERKQPPALISKPHNFLSNTERESLAPKQLLDYLPNNFPNMSEQASLLPLQQLMWATSLQVMAQQAGHHLPPYGLGDTEALMRRCWPGAELPALHKQQRGDYSIETLISNRIPNQNRPRGSWQL